MAGEKGNDMSNKCALCGSENARHSVQVAPKPVSVSLCDTCTEGVCSMPEAGPHWQCLNDAIWSENDATKVVAYRMLHKLPQEQWARDLLDIAYLDPELKDWAKEDLNNPDQTVHRDTNGVVLASGDTVVLIKDLPVKGAGFTAKRGTVVRNISLVSDNAGHIEGRVNGQRIVILTEFVKKS